MRLTAEDVRAVVFDHSGVFARGYKEEQVDDFLDRVEQTIAEYERALSELQRELGVRQPRATSADPGPESGMYDARRPAEELIERARGTARQIEQDAHARALRILASASREAWGASRQAGGASDARREVTAAAVDVGVRMAQLRDAMAAEVTNLHGVIGRMQNVLG